MGGRRCPAPFTPVYQTRQKPASPERPLTCWVRYIYNEILRLSFCPGLPDSVLKSTTFQKQQHILGDFPVCQCEAELNKTTWWHSVLWSQEMALKYNPRVLRVVPSDAVLNVPTHTITLTLWFLRLIISSKKSFQKKLRKKKIITLSEPNVTSSRYLFHYNWQWKAAKQNI